MEEKKSKNKSNNISQVFNPVKEDEAGKTAKRMIWTTASIDLALKGIEQGRRLLANPFYENNTKLLKGDLVFKRTPEEVQEWIHCSQDIIYFANTYCQLMTPEGIRHITLRDYQEEYLRHLQANRLSIMLAARQCGKTVTSAIFMLWYVLFNTDKNALVVGNKRKTAVEILDKVKKIFLELPFFLRPGVYKWNEASIVLDNGCRINSEATTINSGISFTYHCVLADEFAHLPPNIMDKFYNNLFPTITAGKARFMITSTQNGHNLFYRLWVGAVNGDNEYAPFKVTWDMIPEWNPETKQWEKRDKKWYRMQVANYGGVDQFNSQFGTEFQSSASTLINREAMRKTRQTQEDYIRQDLPGVRGCDMWWWKPGYDPVTMLRKEFLVFTGDISEGIGQDYTVFQACALRPDGHFEVVGYLRSNTASRDTVAASIASLIHTLCNPDRVLVSFEKNTYGDLFLKYIEDDDDFDMGCMVKYSKGPQSSSWTYGIKITAGNKSDACQLFKEQYEKGLISNTSSIFQMELDNFCDDGSGHYKASFGHDDMVMSLIQLVFVIGTLQYTLLRQEYDELQISGVSDSDVTDAYYYGVSYETSYGVGWRRSALTSRYDEPTESDFNSIYNF